MIIFTGRFQPFHNGHLYMVEKLRRMFPEEIICLAAIKDVPLSTKNSFDKAADAELSKCIYNSKFVLTMLNIIKQTRKWDNVVITLMPRASDETWGYINSMLDTRRIWAFTQNSVKDRWEEEKVFFYKSKGDEIIRVSIDKTINGKDIRKLIEECNINRLSELIPKEIVFLFDKF